MKLKQLKNEFAKWSEGAQRDFMIKLGVAVPFFKHYPDMNIKDLEGYDPAELVQFSQYIRSPHVDKKFSTTEFEGELNATYQKGMLTGYQDIKGKEIVTMNEAYVLIALDVLFGKDDLEKLTDNIVSREEKLAIIEALEVGYIEDVKEDIFGPANPEKNIVPDCSQILSAIKSGSNESVEMLKAFMPVLDKDVASNMVEKVLESGDLTEFQVSSIIDFAKQYDIKIDCNPVCRVEVVPPVGLPQGDQGGFIDDDYALAQAMQNSLNDGTGVAEVSMFQGNGANRESIGSYTAELNDLIARPVKL
ncbi:hypothetical protein OAT84_03460 [Gammaproteobacteria bacterium]|nr:hypothetical protein [Gammaproteobacteria bacterium]